MKIQKFSWAVGLLVVGLSGAVYAAPAKPNAKSPTKDLKKVDEKQPDAWQTNVHAKDRPEYRQTPIRKNRWTGFQLKKDAWYVEGTMERFDDDLIFITTEIALSDRQALARQRNVPLQKVPATVTASFPIWKELSKSLVKNRMGKVVRLELHRDQYGGNHVTDILQPKP